MRKIQVKLRDNPYDVVCGDGLIARLGIYLDKLEIGSDACVITNALIKRRHGRALSDALLKAGFRVNFKLIPDTEKAKSLEILPGLLKAIARNDLNKRTFIIAFGGGVVGDIAGFAASVYKRGIAYVQVPTTLLAQVDSAIGGKTAVDLAEAKNLVGAFYQPRLVISDTNFLKTLSQRQIRSGLAEVIKYAVIADPRLFAFLEKNYCLVLEKNAAALANIVYRCSLIKADIVSRDEKEKLGLRTMLNFGHTVGHAIETSSGYTKYSHGEAVALGMLAACDISVKLGLLDKKTSIRIAGLISKAGLPARAKNIRLPAVINAYYHDKKFSAKTNRLVLLRGIGSTKIVENVPLSTIKAALKKIL